MEAHNNQIPVNQRKRKVLEMPEEKDSTIR